MPYHVRKTQVTISNPKYQFRYTTPNHIITLLVLKMSLDKAISILLRITLFSSVLAIMVYTGFIMAVMGTKAGLQGPLLK